MILDRLQRTAFARVLSDLIEADHVLEGDEISIFEDIAETRDFRMTVDMLAEAKKMTFARAVELLQDLEQSQKDLICGKLYEVSRSDGTCVPLEALQIMAVKSALEGRGRVFSIPSDSGHIDDMKVLFIESSDDTEADRAIRANLRSINNEFRLAGFDFIYIPEIAEDYKQMSGEYLRKVITFILPSSGEDRVNEIQRELCSMTTSHFTRELLAKRMGINLIGNSPAFLFKIGESAVGDRCGLDAAERDIYSNFLLVETGSDVLEDVVILKDTYRAMVNSRMYVESKPVVKKFLYSGFHRSLFDLVAFGVEKSCYKLVINLQDRSNPVVLRPVDGAGEDVRVELSTMPYALYLLIVQQSIFGDGLDWKDRPAGDRRKEDLLSKFNALYLALGKGNLSAEYKDKTVVSRIKSAIRANGKIVTNIDLFIPELVKRGNDSYYTVQMSPELVHVVEDGVECCISDSVFWSSL